MDSTLQRPEPGTGHATGVVERPAPMPTDDGEHERFSHIIWAPGRDGEAVVLEARINGTPLTALCGKRWIPSRDPKRYPLCPTCKEIRDRSRGGGG